HHPTADGVIDPAPPCSRPVLPLGTPPPSRPSCNPRGTPTKKEPAMTWGIPTDTFLQIHVIISLIALVAGCFVLYGLFIGRASGAWTVLFLGTPILTSVTGFPLPPFGFHPARALRGTPLGPLPTAL